MSLFSSLREYLTVYIGFTGYELNKILQTNHTILYKVYEIRQGRSGKKRFIEEPIPKLKKIQKALIPFFEKFPLHSACTAVKGSGIACNAKVHEDAKHILRIDIKSCYPSIQPHHVITAIDERKQHFPSSSQTMMHEAIPFCFFDATFIPREHRKGRMVVPVLPTGAPTSPILCNIALTPIDYAIEKLIQGTDYKYTRYMDDIHLSTASNTRDWGLIQKVTKILNERNLQVNKKKTQWLTVATDNTVVTGVSLSTDSKVPKEFKRMLRAKLQNLARGKKDLDAETKGCLAYVKSIDEQKYQKFLEYYERRLAYVSTGS